MSVNVEHKPKNYSLTNNGDPYRDRLTPEPINNKLT